MKFFELFLQCVFLQLAIMNHFASLVTGASLCEKGHYFDNAANLCLKCPDCSGLKMDIPESSPLYQNFLFTKGLCLKHKNSCINAQLPVGQGAGTTKQSPAETNGKVDAKVAWQPLTLWIVVSVLSVSLLTGIFGFVHRKRRLTTAGQTDSSGKSLLFGLRSTTSPIVCKVSVGDV